MKRLILFISIIIVFTNISCKKQIDIKLKNSYARIVVDGLITDETKAHVVKVSKTSNYFSSEPESMVAGAVVTLNDGVNTITLTEVSPGFYQTDANYKGEVGRMYTLKIASNSDEYVASCLLKPVAQIDSISFTKGAQVNGPPKIDPNAYSINMFAQEPATETQAAQRSFWPCAVGS